MNSHTNKPNTQQSAWARFRFSIIGALLSCPPDKGELKIKLEELSKKGTDQFKVTLSSLQTIYF